MKTGFIRTARTASRVTTVAAACALLLAGASPAAAKKCVRPGGGNGCKATIQEAIDAATDSETILVRPGVYRGRVNVNKRVLLLGGGKLPGQVVINGRHVLDTVTVEAGGAGATIRNLTVWNSGGALVAIQGGANDVTLSRVILRQSVGDCLSTLAAGTKVIGSSLRNCGSLGVRASGDGFVLRASSVLAASGACVDVGGDGAQLVGNRLRNCEDYGISIFPGGASALVSGNRVLGVTTSGIYVDSGSVTVQGNLVDGAVDYGFEISSARPVLNRNIARNTRSDGFHVVCGAGCAGGQVVRNRAEWSGGDGFDLRFAGEALVRDNVVTGAGNDGFWLASVGPYDIRDNRVQGASVNCYELDDSVTTSAAFTGNTADSCREDGFRVAGDNATLRANRARNALFGFHVDAAGSGAVLENNTATLNNSAFCDDTLLLDLTGKGNNFTDSVCTY
jgi:hypothetical protein